jgi:hypothetical protein
MSRGKVFCSFNYVFRENIKSSLEVFNEAELIDPTGTRAQAIA